MLLSNLPHVSYVPKKKDRKKKTCKNYEQKKKKKTCKNYERKKM